MNEFPRATITRIHVPRNWRKGGGFREFFFLSRTMRVSLSGISPRGNEDYGLKMLLASIEEKREVFEKVHPCRFLAANFYLRSLSIGRVRDRGTRVTGATRVAVKTTRSHRRLCCLFAAYLRSPLFT